MFSWNRNRRRLCLALVWLALCTSVSWAQLDDALDSAVWVKTYLSLVDETGQPLATMVVKGSGWTTSCVAEGNGHRVQIRTAAHLADPDQLLEDTPEGKLWPRSLVHVRYMVRYRDGSRYGVAADGLVDVNGDSALIEFTTSMPRQTLPDGDPKQVQLGDHLRSVACPGGLLFIVQDGVYSAPMNGVGLGDSYPGWWLSSVQAAPGSSGAPVLNPFGEVVAQVVGQFKWPGGTLTVLQPVGRYPGERVPKETKMSGRPHRLEMVSDNETRFSGWFDYLHQVEYLKR